MWDSQRARPSLSVMMDCCRFQPDPKNHTETNITITTFITLG